MTDADLIRRAERIADVALHRRTHPEWSSLRDFVIGVLREHDRARWGELRSIGDARQRVTVDGAVMVPHEGVVS